MYKDRNEFINDNISEKITLAHISASTRLYGFTSLGNGVYSKKTPHIVTEVKNYNLSCDLSICSNTITSLILNDQTNIELNSGLDLESNEVVLTFNDWLFDTSNRTLYLRTNNDIELEKIIATYRLFFSDAPVIASWNLKEISSEVEYETRLLKSPSFKTEIGTNQQGISVSNSGTVELQNNDGYFDDIYDTLIFENKRVEIYSYSREVLEEKSQILFRGNIYDKSFDSDKISLQVKDNYTRLEESIDIPKFSSTDSVSLEDTSHFKRKVYGRVDGHVSKSIDKIVDGYPLTGTLSTDITLDILVDGKATSFLTQTEDGTGGTPNLLSVNDTIIINSFEYTIISLDSELAMTIRSTDGASVEANDDGGEKLFLSTLSGTVTSSGINADVINGVGTTFTTDLENGDIILVQGEYLEIDEIVDDNTIILTTNYPFSFTSSSFSKKTTISIDGELTFLPPNRLITGNGSLFLRECTRDDVLTINNNTYTIERVIDDTNLLVDEESIISFDLLNSSAINKSDSGVPFKNRTFNVSSHYLKESYYVFVSQPQFNRIVLEDVSNLLPDDILYFIDGTTDIESAEISRISGNTITLKQNLNKTDYTPSITIFKNPIYDIQINNISIPRSEIVGINNTPNGCSFTIHETAELSISKQKNLSTNSLLFKSGKNEIDILGSDSKIQDILKTRDYIKGYGDDNSLFTEILDIDDNKIYLRTPYQGVSGIKTSSYKIVNIIDDDTKVSANILGKPKGNIVDADLIQYGPDIIKDLLLQTDVAEFINEASFDAATINSKYTLGVVIPSSEQSTTSPTIKNVADKINQTIFGSMSLSSDLNITYNILDTQKPETQSLRTITSHDIINWNVKSKGNKVYVYTNSTYRSNESTGLTKLYTADNEVALDFETSNKTNDIELQSYHVNESEELTERSSYINSLSVNEISITSDLRLSDLNMGDKLILDIPRLYKRLGDPSSRLKIATIVSVDISGDTVKLKLSDLGNLYNRSSVITPDNAKSFSDANSIDRTYDSYITDENGVIDNNEDIQYINLIF